MSAVNSLSIHKTTLKNTLVSDRTQQLIKPASIPGSSRYPHATQTNHLQNTITNPDPMRFQTRITCCVCLLCRAFLFVREGFANSRRIGTDFAALPRTKSLIPLSEADPDGGGGAFKSRPPPHKRNRSCTVCPNLLL